MRILVTDKLAKKGIEVLTQAGFKVTQKKVSPEELIKIIPRYDALIVRSSTKVTREVIEAGVKLQIIGRAGTGTDNIDVRAATEKGIVVKVTPGGSTNAVAELTVCLMASLSRNIVPSYNSLKDRKWTTDLLRPVLEG